MLDVRLISLERITNMTQLLVPKFPFKKKSCGSEQAPVTGGPSRNTDGKSNSKNVLNMSRIRMEAGGVSGKKSEIIDTWKSNQTV